MANKSPAELEYEALYGKKLFPEREKTNSTKRESYTTWDEFFMGTAMLAATRSKDPKTQVGACIVNDDNRIISVGYNGLTRGMNDDTFPWDSIGEATGDLITTKNPWVVHSELNAILNSYGSDLRNTTMYVTLFPCNECAKAIIQAGIKKVIYLREYKHSDLVRITNTMFNRAGVEVVKYNNDLELTREEFTEEEKEVQKILKRYSPNNR